MSRALRSEIEAGKFPGAVALVARKGHVVYFESFGVRDPASGAPMGKDAIFRLYSMTKPFASVAAMMLMENGNLLLSDPVAKFLPQLAKREVSVSQLDPATGKVVDSVVPADRDMTIQDLLRHTSGLVYGSFTPNQQIKELYAKNGVDWANVTPEEQIERLGKVPLAHQPGTTWEYSLSTDGLGRVVDKVSGQPLGRFLDEWVFGPEARWVRPPGREPMDLARRGALRRVLDALVTRRLEEPGVAWSPIALLEAGWPGDRGRLCALLADAAQRRTARRQAPAQSTVAFMTSDHLGPMKIVPLGGVGTGYGFGLGAVRTTPGIAGVSGSVGEYRWGGAAGTAFWVDPKEEMITVLMLQGAPGPARGYTSTLFRQMVRQAIVE